MELPKRGTIEAEDASDLVYISDEVRDKYNIQFGAPPEQKGLPPEALRILGLFESEPIVVNFGNGVIWKFKPLTMGELQEIMNAPEDEKAKKPMSEWIAEMALDEIVTLELLNAMTVRDFTFLQEEIMKMNQTRVDKTKNFRRK